MSNETVERIAIPVAEYDSLRAEVERLREERDEARADLEIAREAQRCECSTEDMCRFAQEREEARAEVERLRGERRVLAKGGDPWNPERDMHATLAEKGEKT